jgi:hypothetical protein
MSKKKPLSVVFVGNQGSLGVLDFYRGVANGLTSQKEGCKFTSSFTTWRESEKEALIHSGLSDDKVLSFESWAADRNVSYEKCLERLNHDYSDIDWGLVIAAERSFTDYSMQLGSFGDRTEDITYAASLLVSLVDFFEFFYQSQNADAIVVQTADTLLSFVALKVAQHHNILVRAISPAWLLEKDKQGGFYSCDEFTHSHKMQAAYELRRNTPVSEEDDSRCSKLVDSILNFTGSNAFYKSNGRGPGFYKPVTPHLRNIFTYLSQNNALDKRIVYTKFSPVLKIKANLLRLFRNRCARQYLAKVHVDDIPEKSVFYAIHMQPEQSTLAQGNWYVNQVALIENISKSLPIGYTLILKEHPNGPGSRPVWQYRHLERFYNVRFCNADSKSIIRSVESVITVTGTVGMEALVLDKPTIVLGGTFYDFCDLLYRPKNIKELPGIFKRILIEREYDQITDRDVKIKQFLLAYLDGLIPAFPLAESANVWGEYLAQDLVETKK